MKGMISLLVTIFVLAGCANAPYMSRAEKNVAYEEFIASNELLPLKSIRSFRYHGWQSLTNDYLIISTSQRNKYLVKVKGYCPDLTFAHAILINQSMSSVLTTRFDSISLIDSPQLKCFIKSMHKISKQQEKEIRAIGDAPEVDEKDA